VNEEKAKRLVEAIRASKAKEAVVDIDITKLSMGKLTKVLELAVPWCAQSVFIAPGCHIARRLAEVHGRGRVWCTCEVLDMLLSHVSPDEARKIAEAKLTFDGAVSCLPQGGVN
jgi:hypothetical protein